MFKTISILSFILLLDFNSLDGKSLPENFEQSVSVRENENGEQEYVVYVDDLEEGVKPSLEKFKQANAELISGEQQGNTSIYDFGEVDKNGNYVGFTLSDSQIQSLNQKTDQAYTDAKSGKTDFKRNKDQDYYNIEELGEFDLKNKNNVKNEEPIDSKNYSKEKQPNSQKTVYEIDPATLKRSKIRDSYYSLLDSTNESQFPKENVQDNLNDKSGQSVTSPKQQRNESPKRTDIKPDSEYYEEYEYELSTIKSTTDNTETDILSINPGLDYENDVQFKQLSGAKGKEGIQISKVSDKISKGKASDKGKVKYRETVLQPKRKSRILARYKVIIPVIVPNLRIKVPINNQEEIR